MKRPLLAATAVLAFGASIFVAAQQPGGPAPAGPRLLARPPAPGAAAAPPEAALRTG